jgi:hypothetical protein
VKTLKLLLPVLLSIAFLSLFLSFAYHSAQAQSSQPVDFKPPYREPFPTASDNTEIASANGNTAFNTPNTISYTRLSAGNGLIHGLVYYDGHLFASTRADPYLSHPPKILKIDPSSLHLDGVITLTMDLDGGEDIVGANGYIWVIMYSNPAKIIRVNPATMAGTTAVTLSGLTTNDCYGSQRDLCFGLSLKYAFGYLWAGGMDRLVRVNIIDPLAPTYGINDIFDYNSLALYNHVLLGSLTYSDNRLWASLLQYRISPEGYPSSTMLKIDPTNPSGNYQTTNLSPLFPDDIVYTHGHLYNSTENDPVSTSPSDIYKLPDSLTPYTITRASDSASYGLFLNPLDPDYFWGAYVSSPTNPTGKVKKFDLNSNGIVTDTLPGGFSDPSEIAFDPKGNMYVATWQDGSGIIEYTTPLSVTDLTISKSSNNAVLHWSHTQPEVTQYQVWRSTQPYFTPGDALSVNIGSKTSPFTTTVTYIDNGAIGDVNNNYYYMVKAVNSFGLVSMVSNRVGAFNYQLQETAGTDYNWVALSLTPPGINMASDLANYIQSNSNGSLSVLTISRWNVTAQSYDIFYPPFYPFGDFPVFMQYPYRIEVDVNVGNSVVWSLLGNIPNIGSYHYALQETAGTDYNWIMQPLDRSDIINTLGLANDIQTYSSAPVTVLTISRWNATAQSYDIFYPPFYPYGDFLTRPGYPYRVEVDVVSGNSVTWP